MDEKTLRGFCQKCELPIALIDGQEMHGLPLENVPDEALEKTKDHNPVFIWFLSAKQMKIIVQSHEFNEWYGKNQRNVPHYDALAEFLEEMPFLVAKILKENGDKK